MSQMDWIGGAAKPSFRDIRNQRESKAAKKAELCLEIGRLCSKVPPPVLNGDVVAVRRWKAARELAMACAGNSRSSETELSLAVKSMAEFRAHAE